MLKENKINIRNSKGMNNRFDKVWNGLILDFEVFFLFILK